MRGADGLQESLFTVAKLDDFVPADHPLRSIRTLVNEALGRLNSLFNMIYADRGRDSIAPEKLMRALLLQVFYSIRSERQLMEQMRYNLLFRWFVGLSLEDTVCRSGPRKLDSWLSDISALLSDASRRPTGAERDEKTPP